MRLPTIRPTQCRGSRERIRPPLACNTQIQRGDELPPPALPQPELTQAPPVVAGALLRGEQVSFLDFLRAPATENYCAMLVGSEGTAAAKMLRELRNATEFHYFGYWRAKPGSKKHEHSSGKLTAPAAATKIAAEKIRAARLSRRHRTAGRNLLGTRGLAGMELLRQLDGAAAPRRNNQTARIKATGQPAGQAGGQNQIHARLPCQTARAAARQSSTFYDERSKGGMAPTAHSNQERRNPMNIEYTPVKELRPYAANARTHSRKQIRQIAKSIERFGFCNPVLIDDSKQIVAGHGRVEAAKIDRHRGCADGAAFASKRGRQARLHPCRQQIGREGRLGPRDPGDRTAGAYRARLRDRTDRLRNRPRSTSCSMRHAKPRLHPAGPKMRCRPTRPGPRSAASGRSVAARTAPPAVRRCPRPGGLRYSAGWGQSASLCSPTRRTTCRSTAMSAGSAASATPIRHGMRRDGRSRIHDFLATVFERLAANTTTAPSIRSAWTGGTCREMLAAGRTYSELKNLCVWNKTNGGMGSFYRSKHELVFVWKNGTRAAHQHLRARPARPLSHQCLGLCRRQMFRDGPADELAMHPTVKPVALVADAIKDCSQPQWHRARPLWRQRHDADRRRAHRPQARGSRSTPHYVDVAVRRWQTYTGKAAVLAATGVTFEQREEQCATRAASGPVA